jgi:hypothetical protein
MQPIFYHLIFSSPLRHSHSARLGKRNSGRPIRATLRCISPSCPCALDRHRNRARIHCVSRRPHISFALDSALVASARRLFNSGDRILYAAKCAAQ